MRCPRVSRGRMYACFMGCMDSATWGPCGAAGADRLAETLEFTPSGSAFGAGIEGKVREAAASLPVSTLTSVAAFATDFASSPLCGIAPSRRMVANSMVHLSCCESNSVPIRN